MGQELEDGVDRKCFESNEYLLGFMDACALIWRKIEESERIHKPIDVKEEINRYHVSIVKHRSRRVEEFLEGSLLD